MFFGAKSGSEAPQLLLDSLIWNIYEGSTIGIVSAAWFTSKKVLQNHCDKHELKVIHHNGQSYATDAHGNNLVACCIGDGTSIKELKADLIIFIDEHTINRDILRKVIGE